MVLAVSVETLQENEKDPGDNAVAFIEIGEQTFTMSDPNSKIYDFKKLAN